MSIYKIAYILTPVEFGGSEKVSLSFLQHYPQKHIKIIPIALCRPWEPYNLFLNELTKMGLEYRIVPTRLKPRSHGREYFRLVRCTKSIYTELKNGQFDLVHTNGYFADITGLLAANFLNIPAISTCHGFIANDTKTIIYNLIDVFVLRLANQIITVSEKLKRDLIKKGINEKKIQIVQNAVQSKHDTTCFQNLRQNVRLQFGIKENDFLLGYVGRLSAEKGVKYLIEAGRRLIKSGINVQILIIGDGPQKKEIELFAHERGLINKVIFAGFQKDIQDILPAFDIFVLPSLTEGTSIALLEAMSNGLPVIATAVGGTPKVISSEKNGILIPPESSDAIVRAVMQLIESKELMKNVGVAALNTIESRFDINCWLKRIEEIYTETMKINN